MIGVARVPKGARIRRSASVLVPVSVAGVLLVLVMLLGATVAGASPGLPPRSGAVEVAGSPSGAAKRVAPRGPDFPSANRRVNTDATVYAQNESSIDINPTNKDNYIAGQNDWRTDGVTTELGYDYSFDSCATWGDGILPRLGYQYGCDPSVAFDVSGTAYYGGLLFSTPSQVNALVVFRSLDGGVTYPLSTIVDTGIGAADFDDKPYIGTNPYDGEVYMSYTNFTGTPTADIWFSASNDQNVTWASPAPQVISDPANNMNQGSVPAAGNAAGMVYVAWVDYSLNRILIDKSLNGGTTFNALGADTVVASGVTPYPILPTTTGNREALVGQYGNFRVARFPSMDVDRYAPSAYFGWVYVVWPDYRNTNGDIWFSRSSNGGATWTAPLRLNDDISGTQRDQFFPWVSVNETGTIKACWYDRRLSSPQFDVYITHSHDGGATWSPNVRVTTTPSTNLQFGGGFVGDYIGIVASDGQGAAWAPGVPRAVPIWMDTRRGNQDIYATRVVQPAATGDYLYVTGANTSALVAIALVGILGGMALLRVRRRSA